MTDEVRIDVNSLIQNNNGNDRSLTSTPRTDLLENKVAKMLGVVVCGWVVLVLVQGGMVGTLETKDCRFVTLLFFLVFFRCWRHYCPEAYRSFTEAAQSLPVDYSSIPKDIQKLVPSCYIDTLFYCSRFVSAMTSVVLSVMRLVSQDFGKKKVANMESRDFALKVFYGLTLAEALVLLFALTLPFPKKRNSVAPADGPGDGPEDGPGNGPGDGPEDGPGNGPGDGPEDSPGDGPEDRPEDGPENGPGGEPGDGPVNQSMDRPANQSNDLKSEGPADSLPNLRQRRNNDQMNLGSMHGIEMYGGTMNNDQLNLSQRAVQSGSIHGVKMNLGSMHGIQMSGGAMTNGQLNLRQRSVQLACPGKESCALRNCTHNSSNTSKGLGWSGKKLKGLEGEFGME